MKRRREIYLAFGLIFLGIILLFATSGIINTSFSVIKEQTGKYDKVKDKINSKSLLSKDKNKHKKANYALHKVLVKIKTSLWSNIFREDYKKVEKMLLKYKNEYNITSVVPLIKFKNNKNCKGEKILFQWFILTLKADAKEFVSNFRNKKALSPFSYFSYVEYDYKMDLLEAGNDPLYSYQWHLNNTGQDYPRAGGTSYGKPGADIKAPLAWGITKGDQDIVIAVIDTGIDYDHEDIRDRIWINKGEIPGNHIDDDGNGFIDDIIGWDFGDNDNDPIDIHGHGTHVAGIIGATTNNTIGVAGIDWNCKVMPLKFLNKYGDLYVSNAIKSIKYAVDNGVYILNNSYGGVTDYNQSFQDVINYAYDNNRIFVAASGNDNSQITDSNKYYPVCYEHVIGVIATDSWERKYGVYGPLEYVEIAAPGYDILSLRANGTDMYGNSQRIYNEYAENDPNGKYYVATGTSMACPVVVGAMALVKSKFPDMSSEEIINRVICGADDINEYNLNFSGLIGNGRVNLYNALTSEPYPLIYIVNYRIKEVIGNSNTLIDPGETIELDFTLKNIGIIDAIDARGLWNCDSPYINIETNYIELGNIIKGNTVSGTFRFTVASSTPYGEKFNFTLDISDNNGYQKKLWMHYLQTWDKPSSPDSKWEKIVDVRTYFSFDGFTIENDNNNLEQGEISSLVLYDIDKDGKQEIFFTIYIKGIEDTSGDSYRGAVIFGCDFNGVDLPGFPILAEFTKNDEYMHYYYRCTPSIGDIDGDNLPEVIFMSRNKNIYAWDLWPETSDGLSRLKEGFPISVPRTPGEKIDKEVNPPYLILSDIQGDISLEIVNRSDGQIHVYDWKGEEVKRKILWKLDSPRNSIYTGNFATGNVIKVDNKDYLSFTKSQGLYLLDNDLNIMKGFPVQYSLTYLLANNIPVLGDLNNDGNLEIVTNGIDVIQAYNYEGEIIGDNYPVYVDNADTDTYGSICLSDINNDGYLEVVCQMGTNVIVAYDCRGNEIMRVNLEDTNLPPNSFVIDNLDGDNYGELICNYKNNTDLFWYAQNKITATKYNGDNVEGFPKRTNFNTSLTTPSIGDIDGNGYKDILSYSNLVLFCWEHQEKYVSTSSNKIWPMPYHDERNSNCIND